MLFYLFPKYVCKKVIFLKDFNNLRILRFFPEISTFQSTELNMKKMLKSNFNWLLLIYIKELVAPIVKLLFYTHIRTI